MLPIYYYSTLRICRNLCRQPKHGYFIYSKMEMSMIASSGTKNKVLKTTLKLSALGLGLGTIVGTGYTFHLKNKPRGHIVNDETRIQIIKDIPKIEPSRRIRIPGDQTGLKLTLYQYQNCPFCCKVRAFLDYYGISYDVVEVDPVLRQSVKWSSYKRVPIVVAEVEEGYQPLNDSSMIVSALASYVQNSDRELTNIVSSYPFISYFDDDGAVKNEIMNKYFLMLDKRELNNPNNSDVREERKWRKWADDVLVHSLSPNVYRTWEESLQTFNWFSEMGEWEKNFPAWERNIMVYVGAFAMLFIGKRLKKRHNLKDDVRQSLYDDCNCFAKAVQSKGTPFLGGNSPNLADLAVYGVLSSIEGCYAFQDVLNNSQIKNWFFSMKDAVVNHHGSVYNYTVVHN